jgi:hypothetical protein
MTTIEQHNKKNKTTKPTRHKTWIQELEDEAARRKVMTAEQKWQLINELFSARSFAEFSQLPERVPRKKEPERDKFF